MEEHHHWLVDRMGQSNVVEVGPVSRLGGPPRAVTCDGVGYRLGGMFGDGPWVAHFAIGGALATMTRSLMTPGYQSNLRRVAAAMGRNLPAIARAYLIGGAGVAAGIEGAIAADAAVSQMRYDLQVDGRHQGAWVVQAPYRSLSEWTWVPPDERWQPPAPDADRAPLLIRLVRLGAIAGTLLMLVGLAITIFESGKYDLGACRGTPRGSGSCMPGSASSWLRLPSCSQS